MRTPGVESLYRFAWRHARRLPSGLGYALFHLVGDAAWLAHRLRAGRGGVGRLERNLSRILPDADRRELSRATRAAMRSYMRYFYEAFALPGLTPDQRAARVRPVMGPEVRRDVSRGSIVIALPHMGNWDMVGAWACVELAQVLTVAERLDPPDLFEQFVAFRQGLGMRIIGQARGERVFEPLVEAAEQGRYVIALLADRDLSSSGVEAPLCGRAAHVAAGPAAVAERLGLPLYAATVHYERLTGARRRAAGGPWGVVIALHRVPAPPGLTGREAVAERTRAWVERIGPELAAHAVDWHMLQAVFDDDLDPERLARSRARDREGRA